MNDQSVAQQFVKLLPSTTADLAKKAGSGGLNALKSLLGGPINLVKYADAAAQAPSARRALNDQQKRLEDLRWAMITEYRTHPTKELHDAIVESLNTPIPSLSLPSNKQVIGAAAETAGDLALLSPVAKLLGGGANAAMKSLPLVTRGAVGGLVGSGFSGARAMQDNKSNPEIVKQAKNAFLPSAAMSAALPYILGALGTDVGKLKDYVTKDMPGMLKMDIKNSPQIGLSVKNAGDGKFVHEDSQGILKSLVEKKYGIPTDKIQGMNTNQISKLGKSYGMTDDQLDDLYLDTLGLRYPGTENVYRSPALTEHIYGSKKLTSDQSVSLNWTNEVNRAIRSNNLDKDLQTKLDAIDAAFEGQTNKVPLTVFRGINLTPEHGLDSYKVGDVYVDPGHTFVSPNVDATKGFSLQPDSATLEIHVPIGTSMISGGNMHRNPEEALIKRGTKYLINGIKKIADPSNSGQFKTIIEATILKEGK